MIPNEATNRVQQPQGCRPSASSALLVSDLGIYTDSQWEWVLAFIPQPMEMTLLGVWNSHNSQHADFSTDFDAGHAIKRFT